MSFIEAQGLAFGPEVDDNWRSPRCARFRMVLPLVERLDGVQRAGAAFVGGVSWTPS